MRSPSRSRVSFASAGSSGATKALRGPGSRRALLVSGALLALAISAPAGAIELSAPIACPAGMVCPIQNLFDHDPGPAMRDFQCLALGYDGHDGVDIRLPSMAVMRSGVDVRAVAEGDVVATRDGMDDVGTNVEGGREALKSVECGNGVLIRHADGYQTQYCHMRKGSIAVQKGDRVARGQTIGKVGLSGMTEFPHLHLTLKKDGKAIDPYAPDGPSKSCGETKSAWAADAAQPMAIVTPIALNAGFTDGPVKNADIESAAVEARVVRADSPAIVAYARVVGLARGDGLRVLLKGPDGAELARNEVPPADRPKAQWMAYAGKKRPPSGWGAGEYRATVEILRAGKTLKASEISTTVAQ